MHYPNAPDSDVRELVRIITTYKNLSEEQVLRYFPNMKPDILFRLIDRLSKEGRLYHDKRFHRVMYQKGSPHDPMLNAAFWVLLDFLTETSYHTIGEPPSMITFFYQNELYDICCVQPGKELLTQQLFSSMPLESRTKKLVILENIQQMPAFSSADIHAFCLVNDHGETQYFKRNHYKKGTENGQKDIK